MLYAGLDLSRQRLTVHVLNEAGETVTTTSVPPTRDGLHGLVGRVALYGDAVTAVVESMTGGRFVHDELELGGWDEEKITLRFWIVAILAGLLGVTLFLASIDRLV